MRAYGSRLHSVAIAQAACLLICFSLNDSSLAAQAGQSIIPQLQER